MLAAGRGVLKNATEANEWFRRAAEKGYRRPIEAG